MKAVVTGAAGFVGSHLTEHLLAGGHDVIGMDRALGPNLDEARARSGFCFAAGDIRNFGYVSEVITDDADVIFHLAAVVGVSRYLDNPFEVLEVNVIGTRNVLMAAVNASTKVVLASTSEIYGKNPKIPWSEDDDRVLGSTTVDRWSYSTSKATCEHLALAIHRQNQLPVSIVRYFNAYGPRQAPNYVISRSVHRVLNGQRPLLYDGGEQTRCFTYVRDIVEGTAAAFFKSDAAGQVFNLGNTTEIPVRKVTEMILEEAGLDLEWEDFSTADEFGSTYQDIQRRVPDTSKAAKLLGWQATTDLREGIRKTIAWARAHPEWLADGVPMTASAPTATESWR